MEWSNKFMDKFFSAYGVGKKTWYKTLYWYATDSGNMLFRTRLDNFLSKQIDNPDPVIKSIAKDFALKYRDDDERIIAILKYAYTNIKYTTDIDNPNFRRMEYWADASETWRLKRDDCDGINAFIYVVARLSGIPSIKLFSAIGMASNFGHYWVVYFSTKTMKWYAIDGTAWVNISKIPQREEFKFTSNKYNDIWYLFNDSYIYKDR